MTNLGIIGLGTMGSNLARNAAKNGTHIHVYNRTTKTAEEFVELYKEEGTISLARTYDELIEQLKAPRIILLMVKAGEPVDAIIQELRILLDEGDILIDGGNSNFKDTVRRSADLAQDGIEWVGLGVSGGEEGALHGPSMMPGCSVHAWKQMQSIFEPMAAKDYTGLPCITHVGLGGSGHFVKMVHNGIEYAIMQLIAESYDILKQLGKYSNIQLAETYASFKDSSVLDSYLIDITAEIFAKPDPIGSGELIDKILDVAAQKGTGKWTSQYALDYGVAVPTINAAVEARILSGSTRLREVYQKFPYSVDEHEIIPAPQKLASQVRNALKQSILLAYLQGFELIQVASNEEKWNIDLSEVARIWQGGCIIRSAALEMFERYYKNSSNQAAKEELWERFSINRQLDWRRVVQISISRGVPVPAMSSALQYLDTLEQADLPQSLIQAQRDFFGAHTFKRNDKAGDFHVEWS